MAELTAEGGLEEILALLRADGGRITPARRAVVATLVGGDEHLSADDITGRIQAVLPDVQVSTVYRCLDALERLGVVEHVHLGHGPSMYHLSDRQHVHLLCRRCGQVIEVPADYLRRLSDRLGSDYGFVLEPRHFALLGTCSDCGD
ncbi:MAG: Fur family transcriptional regulator [Acidimicrobiales bacterium]